MSGSKYELVCRRCGEGFYHRSPFKQICDKCQRARKAATDKERYSYKKERHYLKFKSNTGLGVNEVIRKLEKYNRDNKKHLTYGQFVLLLERGEVE